MGLEDIVDSFYHNHLTHYKYPLTLIMSLVLKPCKAIKK